MKNQTIWAILGISLTILLGGLTLIFHTNDIVVSGIPADKLERIAEMFGKAGTAAVFYAMGITQHTTGTDNVWSVANLQMLCGNIGKPGGGVPVWLANARVVATPFEALENLRVRLAR